MRGVLFDADAKIDLSPARRAVGFLFQDLALFPHLTVAQNVEYGLARLPADERHARAAAILDAMRVGNLAARKPAEISGGEKQRAALARSIVTDPAMLLLDEPLAALDAITKSSIVEDLRAWNAAHGIPIIYVTHSLEEAFAVGEAVVVLEAGKIIARGSPLEVLDAPRQEIHRAARGFENLFDATVSALHEDRGTMTCALGDSALELEVPLTHTQPGARLRVAIRAGDIMLATSASARHQRAQCFRGNHRDDPHRGALRDRDGRSGAHFQLCSLTLGSRDGPAASARARQVWLVIKTYSCHLVAA